MILEIPANFYQQFDADYSKDFPAEGFNGWMKKPIPMSLENTAIVVMHAWDTGTRDQYPGWYNFVEYLERANKIGDENFPRLLNTIRNSPIKIFHVVSSGNYYKSYKGYKEAKKLSNKFKTYFINSYPKVKTTQELKNLREFRRKNAGVGIHNQKDIDLGFKNINFHLNAIPLANEKIAENSIQLFALCKKYNIHHLIYVGFAINWCLLLSPGGMADMAKFGLICSTIKEATTAVENKETAREELCKKIALWRVSLMFGFVFDLSDILNSLESARIK